MPFERMSDKSRVPTEAEMSAWTGSAADCWRMLREEVEGRFGLPPETAYGGAKYGWQIRYRKGGRTLCTLFPERHACTVLIVLGSKETARAAGLLDGLSTPVRDAFDGAGRYADGLWMWPRVQTPDDVASVVTLLGLKRRPLR